MGTSLLHLGATLPWMALLTGDNTAAVASGLPRARWPWPQPARAFRLGTVATAARDREAAASPQEE
jgi:hypothetical protein